MVHFYNPSIQEVEEGELRVQGQPGLHSRNPVSKNPRAGDEIQWQNACKTLVEVEGGGGGGESEKGGVGRRRRKKGRRERLS
jgi:hypothetical protein